MAEERQELRRSLKARHMNMIAIGGAIGTGLFVAGGETVSSAGPGGALVAYSFIGVMVYFLMTSLGEMAAYLPVSGSFETYANRYVDILPVPTRQPCNIRWGHRMGTQCRNQSPFYIRISDNNPYVLIRRPIYSLALPLAMRFTDQSATNANPLVLRYHRNRC